MSFDNSIAYTTNTNGTATGVVDLVEKIKDFLINQAGFNLIADKAQGVDPLDKYIVAEIGGIYYHFQTHFNNTPDLEGKIFVNINKSFNDSLTFWQQANTTTSRNSPTKNETKSIPVGVNGVPQFYIYFNTKNIYIVTEFEVGFYSHLSMGLADAYTNKEVYYMNSTLNGNYLSLSNIQDNYSLLFGENTNLNYEAFEDNIAIDIDDVRVDGQDYSRINLPSFSRDLKERSFISTDNKSLLWSPSLYLPNRNNTYYKPVLKHASTFLTNTDSYFDTEEFSFGLKKFKFFPLYQKIIPSNYNLPGQGCGICLRIE